MPEQILYETGDYFVTRADTFKGFQVWRNVGTHAASVARIGYEGQKGLDRAKAEADRRRACGGMQPAVTLQRIGGFYEAFDADADTISEALCLTRTIQPSSGRRICGVPAHAVEAYKARLERQGYAVTLTE